MNESSAEVDKTPRVFWRYALPNMVTLGALSFGLTALKFTGDKFFVSAIACILIAAVLDSLDGRVARAMGSNSKFGAELDSLADVICFGVVPAYMVYEWGLIPYGYVGWAACLIFTAACALRLARFNVSVADVDLPLWRSHFFTGVPAPAGAFLCLAPLYAHYAKLLTPEMAALFALFWVPVVAMLMVSTWPTFSSKSLSRKALRLFFVPTIILATALVAGLYFAPWATLTSCCVCYLLSFLFSKLRFNRNMKRLAG